MFEGLQNHGGAGARGKQKLEVNVSGHPWLPSYLVNVRHLSLQQAGASAVVPYLTFTLGEPIGGWDCGPAGCHWLGRSVQSQAGDIPLLSHQPDADSRGSQSVF